MSAQDSGNREKKVIFLVIVLFFNLVLMSGNIILKNNRSLLMTTLGAVVSPLQIAFQSSVDFVSRQFRHYVFVTNQFSEYRSLKGKYRNLKYENYRLRQQLRKLDFCAKLKKIDSSSMSAESIGFDFNFPFNTILINRGKSSGIVPDMVVLNSDGDLVGRVVEPITAFSARVRLITSATGGVGAHIRSNDLEGFLSGSNRKLCDFKYLMEGLPVKVGDEVYTSGTDRIYPAGIPIGKVISIKKEFLVQKVLVLPGFIGKPLKNLAVLPNEKTL